MDLDNLTKEQITILISCLNEVIIQTCENLSRTIISDKEDERHFIEINKHLKEAKKLHALLVDYKSKKWGLN